MITKINTLQKIIIPFALFFSITIFAQTELASFFDNNMVLQRNERVAIWGHDKPGVKILVSGSWEEEATVKTNKEGAWSLNLQTPDAGGPYMVEIHGSEKITLKNVLIGEVWLCSGQSNMWIPLKGYNNSGINRNNETILNSKNDMIRFFTTEKKASLKPLVDVTGQWLVAEPATAVDFSALAYYFGVKLNDILNIPIGLIHTSWGGTVAETWTSGETIAQNPDFETSFSQLKKINLDDYASTIEKEIRKRVGEFTTVDQGMSGNQAIWAATDLDDRGWKTMKLPGIWEHNGLEAVDGVVWFRKEVTISQTDIGKDATINLGKGKQLTIEVKNQKSENILPRISSLATSPMSFPMFVTHDLTSSAINSMSVFSALIIFFTFVREWKIPASRFFCLRFTLISALSSPMSFITDEIKL